MGGWSGVVAVVGRGWVALLTSSVVKLALRQASGLHHGATGRLGRGHGGREATGLAIGKLGVGKRRRG